MSSCGVESKRELTCRVYNTQDPSNLCTKENDHNEFVFAVLVDEPGVELKVGSSTQFYFILFYFFKKSWLRVRTSSMNFENCW
jgi:hypothetical protein